MRGSNPGPPAVEGGGTPYHLGRGGGGGWGGGGRKLLMVGQWVHGTMVMAEHSSPGAGC